tara:strand:+ start:30 stop:464 length:435 start_codon:yes stop_codon:yes gene_type:complete
MIKFISDFKENYDRDINNCIDSLIDKVIDNMYDYYKENNINHPILIDKRLDDHCNFLNNVKYIDLDSENTPLGVYIIYISKNKMIKKSGFLVQIINDNIYKLKSNNKYWLIYLDKYFVFYKIPIYNKLRHQLEELCKNDFRIKK